MPTVKDKASIESALTTVLRHPVRVQALTILTETEASPKEIADEINDVVSNVSYHVRALRKAKLVEVVREQKVRGAVQHFYKAVERPHFTDKEWAALSADERRPTSLYALQLAVADAAAAMERGTFDRRPDRYLVRTPGVVDREGWRELNAMHGEMLTQTLEILANSADRMAVDADADQIPVSVIAMFFERMTRSSAL